MKQEREEKEQKPLERQKTKQFKFDDHVNGMQRLLACARLLFSAT